MGMMYSNFVSIGSVYGLVHGGQPHVLPLFKHKINVANTPLFVILHESEVTMSEMCF